MQKGQLNKVKNYIICNWASEAEINPTFFDIEPSELDPLQKKEEPAFLENEEGLKETVQSLLNTYKDIQGHF